MSTPTLVYAPDYAPIYVPPTTQDDQPQQYSTAEKAAIAALATWLAGSTVGSGTLAAMGAAGTAVALPAAILAQLARLGVSGWAARAAAGIATTDPLADRSGTSAGLASARTAAAEPRRRAAYLLNAGRRLVKAAASPATGRPRRGALFDALSTERRYWSAHRAAQAHRADAAVQVDHAAARSVLGILRWQAELDSRTTPDCAALHGQLFTLADPPGGVYPGQVHARCRCTAQPA